VWKQRAQKNRRPFGYIATIGRAHIGAGLLNPCSGEAVRLAIKKMGRRTSARQAQARAFGWDEIKQFIGSAGKGLRADRAGRCYASPTITLGVVAGEVVGARSAGH